FSQTKPLRQVKFKAANVDAQVAGGSYVTSTPGLEQATLEEFMNGHEQLRLPAPKPTHSSSHHHGHSHPAHGFSARALGLQPTSSAGNNEVVKAAVEVPFPVLYPAFQTISAEQEQARAYTLKDQQNNLRHAYVVVWHVGIGGYYDFQGADWPNPPLFAHARTQAIDGHEYWFVNDGPHIHVIGWRSHKVVYWITNTLLEELSNQQMLTLAKSAQPLR
ncbi:MAG TPA: hypothetical protein VMG80_04265, partial [Solirubrobacteraceae bacterium]|nr:hypothetical protein [Solirubrobacteraceae bacterium]